MRYDELAREIIALMTFSCSLALALVSIIAIIAALSHEPVFALAGIGGIAAGAFIMQASSTIVARRPVTLVAGLDGE